RREPLDAREYILLARDRLVKALLRDIARDRQTRGERFVFAAKRAVELAQEIGAEAGGERRARQVEDVADAFQAEARERGGGVVRLVLGYGRESWMHGARLRQREARRESEPLRRGVDREQEIEVAALAEDDEGRRCFTPLPCDAVGRKPIQPQAQNALRARNAAPHCSTPRSMLRDDHGGCARDARGAAADPRRDRAQHRGTAPRRRSSAWRRRKAHRPARCAE